MALTAEVQEVVMQRMVLEELGLLVLQPTVIREDKKRANCLRTTRETSIGQSTSTCYTISCGSASQRVTSVLTMCLLMRMKRTSSFAKELSLEPFFKFRAF